LDATSTPPIREAWYFALPSHKLKAGAITAKTMLGEPVLLGRGRDGAAFALVDICPHRGIPLRYGRFDGTEIECCYHGWRFGMSGACTAIPPLEGDQLPDLSKIRVRSYPVTETQGGIWVYFGRDPALAPPIPVLPELAGLAPKIAVSMLFEGDFDHAAVGLMDPSHGPYVHNAWFWRKAPRPKQKHFEPSPWGFTMTKHAPASNSRAYRILGDPAKLTTEIVFRLPGVRWEVTRIGRHLMCNFTTLTPIGPAATEINHLIYWTQPWLAPLRWLGIPFARAFLAQDRDIVRRQREGLRYDPQLLLLGDPDVPARWYYRLKNEFTRALDEARAFENPVRERTLRWRS
jgi:phenylpropionate dioxygenase-like ring-hydroxylating dioxygenase large terminal subunit